MSIASGRVGASAHLLSGEFVAVDRQGIERRFGETGWLELERGRRQELAVRLGPRFTAGA